MVNRRDGMPIRLTRIDELALAYHPYLQAGDECFYWGEYRVHQGYTGGPTNQLISNLKKSPLLVGTPQYFYKERDIQRAGVALGGSLRTSPGPFTIVPVPPSKQQGHPEYDDRMVRIARLMVAGTTWQVQELVRQTESYEASHAQDEHRMTPEELIAIYEIPAEEPEPAGVMIVLDDVLTMGAHFRAVKTKIHERYPEKRVVGLTIARSVDDPTTVFDPVQPH